MSTILGPFEAHVIWGECPEDGATPVSYYFQTQAELDAFWLGITEADGWLGCTEVEDGTWHYSSIECAPVLAKDWRPDPDA